MPWWFAIAMGAGSEPVVDGSIVDQLMADVDGDGQTERITVSSSMASGFEVRVGRYGCVPGGYAPGAVPVSEPRLRTIDAAQAGVPLLEVQAADDAGVRTYLLHVDRAEGYAEEQSCSRIHAVYAWHRLVEGDTVVQAPEVVFDAADRTITATVASASAHGRETTVVVSLWDEGLRTYVPIETWEMGSTTERERICDSW